jgi:RHS repeat-associated protein
VYDAASNRTSLTDPEGGSTSYAYDSLNRLTTLTPPTAISSGNFTFTYDALSRRTQLARPNGVNTDYTYDALSRLLTVLHKLAGNTIDGATYTVDNVGNRTAKTNHLSGAPTEAYTYDAIYQLTQVVQNGSTTTESYTYDGVGNRLSSLGVSPYSYNSSNQLTARPNETYTYDNNGNTTSKTDASGTTTYAWDYENRLTQVTLPGSGGTVNFTYDPLGRRVRKTFSSATTIYAYNGENIVEETDASGAAVARYAMGLSIDEPLAMLRSSSTYYYSADGLGSVTSLTDGSGAIATTHTYDAFGNLAASSGSVVNPFRYTAREWDPETSHYYYRARYFDQRSGRFISEDPIAFAESVNFYAYVFNNPTGRVDPSGLDCRTIGSYTRCWDQKYDWQKLAEDAHESAHRDAGLAKQLNPLACPDLEADAFRREVNSGAYQKRLKELDEKIAKKCISVEEKKERDEIAERLSAAKDLSERKNAVEYCRANNPLYKRWIK